MIMQKKDVDFGSFNLSSIVFSSISEVKLIKSANAQQLPRVNNTRPAPHMTEQHVAIVEKKKIKQKKKKKVNVPSSG